VKPNPCGKRRNHGNSDKSGKAQYQAHTLGIFCKDREHPYHLPVGGRDCVYPCKKRQEVNNSQGGTRQKMGSTGEGRYQKVG